MTHFKFEGGVFPLFFKVKINAISHTILRHDACVSINTILYSLRCSLVFPSVFGWGEATVCNESFMQFGGCTIYFGSFCVYSSVYMLGHLLLLRKKENHHSWKKSILLCRSSVKTPILSIAGVHKVVGSLCLGHIQCSVTASCQWSQKLRIGKMYGVIIGFGLFRKSR